MTAEEMRNALITKSFDGFVTDESNQAAYDTCKLICELNEAGSSFVLVGPEDCGKTHLLQSVSSTLESENPKRKVKLTCGDDVGGRIIDCMVRQEEGGMNKLLSEYLENDVIIIDDIDFLIGKSYIEGVFNDFIKRANLEEKLLLLSIGDFSYLEKILNPELRDLLSNMRNVQIGGQSLNLRRKWMSSVITSKIEDFPLNIAEQILDHAKSIRDCVGAVIYYKACVEHDKMSLWDEHLRQLKEQQE